MCYARTAVMLLMLVAAAELHLKQESTLQDKHPCYYFYSHSSSSGLNVPCTEQP